MTKSSEIGLPGCQHYCRTHLGHLLKPGDLVLGYGWRSCWVWMFVSFDCCCGLGRFDVANSNVNDENLSKLYEDHVPDLV